ncbi:MAG: SMP-30/gluconolactonase/LRE family protein [Terriglobia bacterium]
MTRKLSIVICLTLCCFLAACYQAPPAPLSQVAVPAGAGSIVQMDPAVKEVFPTETRIEKIADGFAFVEGPVWINEGTGVLLFSDIPRNQILKWAPETLGGGTVTEFRKPSGYSGPPEHASAYMGSNGLTLDKQRRLIICEHGNRRVTRLEKDGQLTVLANQFEGKKLNSPNDAVYRSDGSLYFTDPPYGLASEKDQELPFSGIYRLKTDGQLQLLSKELTRPNGLAFSPDEKSLYVSNSDPAHRLWMAFDVAEDGSLANSRVLLDVTAEKDEGLPDGMKVDSLGYIYATGPGGIWILTPQGKHLGTIKPTESPANCGWGEADVKTLYMTAKTGLYRIRLKNQGIRP